MEMKILALKRLRNSYYGNPKFEVVAQDKYGKVYIGTTKTDSSIGYKIESKVGRVVKMVYHTTRSGNVIFDYIKD